MHGLISGSFSHPRPRLTSDINSHEEGLQDEQTNQAADQPEDWLEEAASMPGGWMSDIFINSSEGSVSSNIEDEDSLSRPSVTSPKLVTDVHQPGQVEGGGGDHSSPNGVGGKTTVGLKDVQKVLMNVQKRTTKKKKVPQYKLVGLVGWHYRTAWSP